MSGKSSQWGIVALILIGLAVLLFGTKKPETTEVTPAAVEAKVEAPKAKKATVAKKVTHSAPAGEKAGESTLTVGSEGHGILRN